MPRRDLSSASFVTVAMSIDGRVAAVFILAADVP